MTNLVVPRRYLKIPVLCLPSFISNPPNPLHILEARYNGPILTKTRGSPATSQRLFDHPLTQRLLESSTSTFRKTRYIVCFFYVSMSSQQTSDSKSGTPSSSATTTTTTSSNNTIAVFGQQVQNIICCRCRLVLNLASGLYTVQCVRCGHLRCSKCSG